jgi:hypothetical protein
MSEDCKHGCDNSDPVACSRDAALLNDLAPMICKCRCHPQKGLAEIAKGHADDAIIREIGILEHDCKWAWGRARVLAAALSKAMLFVYNARGDVCHPETDTRFRKLEVLEECKKALHLS